MKKILIFVSVVSFGLLVLFAVKMFQKMGQRQVVPQVTSTDSVLLSRAFEESGLTLENEAVLMENSLVATVSGISVVFDVKKDFGTQVRALQLVLGRLTMNGENKEKIKEIDLRFSKVIVR